VGVGAGVEDERFLGKLSFGWKEGDALGFMFGDRGLGLVILESEREESVGSGEAGERGPAGERWTLSGEDHFLSFLWVGFLDFGVTS